jgi:hypothetical protein
LRLKFEDDGKYKKKDEFIEKLTELYNTVGGNSDEPVDIKTLWRWLKGTVTKVHGDKSDKNERNLYKEFCEKIIREYELKDINELIGYINSLLAKNSKNKKRVEKIKNILLAGKFVGIILEPISSRNPDMN